MEAMEDRRLLATIVVNNPTDTPVTGQTDLREAIALAHADSGRRHDHLRLGRLRRRPQTITLDPANGQLTLDSDMTITGPSVGVTIARSTAAGTPDFRIMGVNSGVTATLENLTITGGNAGSSSGGAIFNSGTLTLTNSTLSGNSAGGIGGGIFNGIGDADADQLHPVGQLGRRRRRRHLHQRRHADADQLHPVGQLGRRRRRRHQQPPGQLRHLPAPTLTLTNSTLSRNSAGGGGGGILSSGGTPDADQLHPVAATRPATAAAASFNGGQPAADADQLHPVGQLGQQRRRHLQLRHGDADQLHPVGQLGQRQRRRHLQLRHGDADQLHPVGQLGQRQRRRYLHHRRPDADQLHPVGQLAGGNGGGIANSINGGA